MLVSSLLIGCSFPLRRGVAVSTAGVAWALMRYRHRFEAKVLKHAQLLDQLNE